MMILQQEMDVRGFILMFVNLFKLSGVLRYRTCNNVLLLCLSIQELSLTMTLVSLV